MSNEMFEALPVGALLLELLVLGWRLWRGDVRPIAALNGVVALGLGVPLFSAVAAGPAGWADGVYAALTALFAFQLLALGTSLAWAARRSPLLTVLVELVFAIYVLITLAVAIFALTFEVKVEL